MSRPVHSRELGKFFEGLRPKDWTPSDAARYAAQRKIRGLSRNVIFRLENGMVKHYDAQVLRAVAELYKVPYADIAAHVVGAIYGGDLIRHAGTEPSDLSNQREVGGGESTTARVRELEDRVASYRTLVRRLREGVRKVIDAPEFSEESVETPRPAPRGGHHR